MSHKQQIMGALPIPATKFSVYGVAVARLIVAQLGQVQILIDTPRYGGIFDIVSTEVMDVGKSTTSTKTLGVAQLVSVLGLEPRSRLFESSHPDQWVCRLMEGRLVCTEKMRVRFSPYPPFEDRLIG